MRQNVSMFLKSFLHCRFTVVVKIDDVEYARGTGKNKRDARAVAAKESWEMIEKQVSKLWDLIFEFYLFFFLEKLKMNF